MFNYKPLSFGNTVYVGRLFGCKVVAKLQRNHYVVEGMLRPETAAGEHRAEW